MLDTSTCGNGREVRHKTRPPNCGAIQFLQEHRWLAGIGDVETIDGIKGLRTGSASAPTERSVPKEAMRAAAP